MRVLVTGAGGFVGRAAVEALGRSNRVRSVVRSSAGTARLGPEADPVIVDDIGPATQWGPALAGVEVVVHLAARVHVLREQASDPLAEFRRVNVSGTERLARAAAEQGARRFVFVSSVGVNGSESGAEPLTEGSQPRPHTPYARSKWEAELKLREIESETGMEVVILRPPLVYGPDAPGNFARLLRLVRTGLPLPLGRLRSRRSMIGVRNLADAISVLAREERAGGETFFVADTEVYSTAELVRTLGRLMERPVRLLPVPVPFLRAGARLVGKEREVDQLAGSLVVSTAKIRGLCRWTPPWRAEDGLNESVQRFLRHRDIGQRAGASPRP
jgi:nucleoside-diphosphate-sugar epimerase